jgi:hypothetical protein
MLVDEVHKGCPDKGCNDSREMHGLPLGAFVEDELHLSWMQMFPSPFMPFMFILYCFFFKKPIRGHCPGVVTSGGNVTLKHFHGNEKVGLSAMSPHSPNFKPEIRNSRRIFNLAEQIRLEFGDFEFEFRISNLRTNFEFRISNLRTNFEFRF